MQFLFSHSHPRLLLYFNVTAKEITVQPDKALLDVDTLSRPLHSHSRHRTSSLNRTLLFFKSEGWKSRSPANHRANHTNISSLLNTLLIHLHSGIYSEYLSFGVALKALPETIQWERSHPECGWYHPWTKGPDRIKMESKQANKTTIWC